MPDPELPEGFAFEDEEALPEGFEVDEEIDLNAGSEQMPTGHRETGNVSRVIEVPGFDFRADARGNVDAGRALGPSRTTEYREVAKDPRYAAERRAAMLDLIERERRGETETPRPWTRVHGEMLFGTELGGRDFASGEGAGRFVDRIGDIAEGRTGLDLPRPYGGGDVRVLNRGARRSTTPSGLLDLLIPTAETDQPIVGSDMRPQSGVIGATDAATFGFFDELAGQLTPGLEGDRDRRRDRERRLSARAEEQAPGTYALGEAAGTIPQALAPMGGQTALARMGIAGGIGLGSGTLRGAGDSTAEDMSGLASDAVRGGLTEGLLAGGTQGVGEWAGPALGRLAQRVRARIPVAQQQATQSALEARGIWGRDALETARERPGGAEALVRELDELNAPNNPRLMPEFIDRMLAEEGPRVGRIAGEIDDVADQAARQRQQGLLDLADETGGALPPADTGRVNTRGVARRLDALAEQQSRMPLTGPRPAEALREHSMSLRNRYGDDGMRFTDAHQQRIELDRQINYNNPNPSLSSLTGQRHAMRRAFSDEMNEAANRAGVGDQWRNANQRYSLASELDDIARGVERNNVQGGLGGAMTRAQGFSRLMNGSGALERLRGAAEMVAGPAAMQELRYSLPHLNRRRLEAMIPVLRGMSPRLQRAAQTLEAAARRGQTALASAHYTLSRTDPEYRTAVEQMQQEEQE